MKVDISKLKSVKGFADILHVSPAHIYQMIIAGRIKCIEIDGIKFVDTEATPYILPLKPKK